jgi:glutathione S-transferase
MRMKPTVYHIPVCPFCQRLEILLALKGEGDALRFSSVDITRPRDPALLEKTRGTTSLPVLETESGAIIKESLVILRYLDERLASPIARSDPYERAVENMLIAQEGPFADVGYRLLMNQDTAARPRLVAAMDAAYARLDDFLRWQAPEREFLFEDFSLAEAVFTPLFMRFWCLAYYEAYEIPRHLERVRRWHDACIAHPVAGQVCEEEIVKLYYDYSRGKGNGALPEGREVSTFAYTPHWRERPWPPRSKAEPASDEALGLVSSAA